MYIKHGIFGVIVLTCALCFFVFSMKFEMLECEGSVCSLYYQKGLLGKKVLYTNFYRSDVYDYELSKKIYNAGSNARAKSRKSNLHDEYTMTLYLKNGDSLTLPFESYDSTKRMNEIYTNIKGTAPYKIDGRFEMFKMPL